MVANLVLGALHVAFVALIFFLSLEPYPGQTKVYWAKCEVKADTAVVNDVGTPLPEDGVVWFDTLYYSTQVPSQTSLYRTLPAEYRTYGLALAVLIVQLVAAGASVALVFVRDDLNRAWNIFTLAVSVLLLTGTVLGIVLLVEYDAAKEAICKDMLNEQATFLIAPIFVTILWLSITIRWRARIFHVFAPSTTREVIPVGAASFWLP